ncbi:MAG: two-component regulator propeller domain-containing protein [Bacteroidales bacterium]
MKRILLIISILLGAMSLSSQIAIGDWRTHFSYSSVTIVEEAPTKIFGVSAGELFYYDKSDGSSGSFNKINGLSDSNIKQIAYSSSEDLLVICYENGNVDLLTGDGVFNIPDIKNKILSSDKEANHIYIEGREAYLSMPFGVVVLNLRKGEVKDSYLFPDEVKASVVDQGYLYVARTSGVYRGKLSDNLLDISNWSLDVAYVAEDLVSFQGNLLAKVRGNGVYVRRDGSWNFLNDLHSYAKMKSVSDHLVFVGGSSMVIFEDLNSRFNLSISGVSDCSSIKSGELYLAQGSKGINSVERSSSGEWSYIAQQIVMDGPSTNNAFSMSVAKDRMYVVGGGRWGNNENIPAALFYFDEDRWVNVDVPYIDALRVTPRDFIRVIADPKDKSHVYVASWGEGLYEFRDDEFVELYNSELNNTSIQSIFPGQSIAKNYNRIDGFAYDSKGNLFMTNTEVPSAISVLKADGTWSALTYSQLANKGTIGEIIITRSGLKWVVVPRPLSQKGVFVFDDQGTIDVTSDDKTRFFSSFYDQDGKLFNPVYFYCIVEDKDGKLWIGTELGPIVLNSPSRAFDSNFTATRIKVPRNDGTNLADYLLEYVPIKTIVVDGGNRKWFGTEGSGVYLISADGQETIHHFTTENSILPSNNVISIAIHPTTGEVFFGTDGGIVSFRADATEGASVYNNVYAFPNPVRPGYEGIVTVTGLVAESTVKITDINNNLMCEGTSTGGQFVWDQRDLRGDRVGSGVYLVYASSENSSGGVVSKIMIVR